MKRNEDIGLFTEPSIIGLNVAKAGGLQNQGAKGDAVALLLRSLSNAGSGVLRLSRKGRKHARTLVFHWN